MKIGETLRLRKSSLFLMNEVYPGGSQKEKPYYSLYFRTYFAFESNYTPVFDPF